MTAAMLFLKNRTRVLIAAIAVAVLCGACGLKQRGTPPVGVSFDSEYQAVLLTNGQVFFGKLEGLGTPYPVLREVYYVRTVPVPDDGGGKTANVLVRRGMEWHTPDYMVINAEQIVLVEPVGKESRVAQLIVDEKEKAKAGTPPTLP